MIIPGFLISIATFPGVIVHEMAHQLFCRWQRVAVFDVCYFRVGNPAGYVIHEIPPTAFQQLLIGIGPFFVNTILGAVIAFPGAIPALKFESGDLLDYFFIWLGVSIAMHSFPSTGDAKGIWQALRSKEVPWITRLIAAPIVLLIYVGAIGSFIWLDLIYGAAVALALPNLISSLFA
jgi:hypothetical protein